MISNRKNLWRATLPLLLGVAGLLAITAPAVAEDGAVMRFPIVGKTRFPSGLQMTVDTRWVEAQGYRPIRIQLGTTPAVPSTADRTIRVDIKVFSRYYGDEVFDRTTAYVTLPQGKTSIQTTIPVLQESLWSRIEIETFEGRAKLLDLSSTINASASARRANQGYGWDQDALSFLVVNSNVPERSRRTAGTSGATPAIVPINPKSANGEKTETPKDVTNKTPDLRNLALQIPDPVTSYNYNTANGYTGLTADDPASSLTDAQLVDWLATRSNFEMLPPGEVPFRWLELTGFDFIILSLEEAEGIAKSEPKRWEAIRKWLRAGGNLLIYGTGPDKEKHKTIDALLNEKAPSPGWNSLAASSKTTSVEFINDTINNTRGDQVPGQLDINKEKPTTSFFTTSSRTSGLGYVVAIQESDVFPGSRRQWTSLINSIASWRALWSVRNGVSLSDSNSDSFWLFAIPGFGLAPVMLFVGLITVFVIMLGPVNYVWLKRRNQLSLLIFTVPIGAFLTIFSLAMYALFGDGLYTRVRVWSLTELDQRTGLGTSLSHQTYYSGIPPWEGLQFPSDAAVYPVDQLPETMAFSGEFEMRRSARERNWDDAQNLTRGYINSRTLSQVVVVQPIRSEAKIVVKDHKLTNQLGAKIEHLVIRGEDEELLYCASVSSGATSDLRPLTEANQDAIKDLIELAKPQVEKDFNTLSFNSAMSGNSRRIRSFRTGRSYSVTPEGDGILLEEMKVFEELSRTKSMIAPRTFLAIVDKSPQLPKGSAAAIEVGCLHLMRGKW